MSSKLSKTSYAKIEELFGHLMDSDMVTKAMTIIRDTTKFDPTANTYNEKVAASIKKYREKKKAEGISTYVSSGSKKSYEKRKKNKE